jgi:hypothetical protein
MKFVLFFCFLITLLIGKVNAIDNSSTCDTVSEFANSNFSAVDYTKICDRLLQSDPACKKVQVQKRMKCGSREENEILNSNNLSSKTFGCLKAFFWDSMAELGEMVIKLIKTLVGLQVDSIKSMYKFLTDETFRNKLIENSGNASAKAGRLGKAFLNSSAQYFAKEYPRNVAKYPFDPLQALGKTLTEPLMTFMSSTIQSIIAEYVPQYQCMNGAAKLSTICRLGGEILMPPMILFTYLKHGIKGLNSISKSIQVTKLKNSFKVLNEVQDAKVALKFSKPRIVIKTPDKKSVKSPKKLKAPKSLTMEEIKINKIAALARTPELDIQLDHFFETLNTDFGKNLKLLEDYTLKESYETKDRFIIGNKLHETIQPNTPIHDSYLKLGYKSEKVEVRVSNGDLQQFEVLRPPTNLSQIYGKAYRALLGNLDKGVSHEDLILPALVFEKREGDYETVFQVVRPLLDDIPKAENGWQISSYNATLSDIDFSKALGSGRHPLVAQMYHHDLAHIADDITNPEIMVQKRRYYEREAKLLSVPSIHADSNAGQYLNEFLITLNLKSKKDIIRLLNPVKNVDNATRKQQLLHDIDKGDFHKRLEEISSNFHKLFSCNGGGCLDGRALFVFPYQEMNFAVSMKIMGLKGETINSLEHYLANNSFWGYVKQMDNLSVHLKEAVAKGNSAEIKNIKTALAESMLELEQRTSAALSNNVDSIQIWKDVNSDDFSKTQSYQFFREVSKPGDLESAFLDGTFRTEVGPH